MEFERLAQIVAEVMNLNREEIRPESDLAEDLGADSLDVYQIIIDVEDELQTEIPAEDAVNVRTVKDILNLANKAQG